MLSYASIEVEEVRAALGLLPLSAAPLSVRSVLVKGSIFIFRATEAWFISLGGKPAIERAKSRRRSFPRPSLSLLAPITARTRPAPTARSPPALRSRALCRRTVLKLIQIAPHRLVVRPRLVTPLSSSPSLISLILALTTALALLTTRRSCRSAAASSWSSSRSSSSGRMGRSSGGASGSATGRASGALSRCVWFLFSLSSLARELTQSPLLAGRQARGRKSRPPAARLVHPRLHLVLAALRLRHHLELLGRRRGWCRPADRARRAGAVEGRRLRTARTVGGGTRRSPASSRQASR